MNYCVDLGVWNSVFAVPSEVVDKHLKLAGATQIKVLLWVLRHSGEQFCIDDVADALSMHALDVKDCVKYWVENGLIKEPDEKRVEKDLKVEANESKLDEVVLNRKRAPIRQQKPNIDYIEKRVDSSEEMKFLVQEAQVILARPISDGDISSFVMFHDVDGLPIDVIIMLLQYAVSVGKTSMRYIERVAIDWGQEGIDSVEKVEEKIKALNKKRTAWGVVSRIIGIDSRSPSAKEEEMCDRWINKWGMKEELINEAYERCVNAKGKFIPSYVDKIIKNFREKGITTISQAVEERKSSTKKGYVDSSIRSSYKPSYDIDSYESEDIFNN